MWPAGKPNAPKDPFKLKDNQAPIVKSNRPDQIDDEKKQVDPDAHTKGPLRTPEYSSEPTVDLEDPADWSERKRKERKAIFSLFFILEARERSRTLYRTM